MKTGFAAVATVALLMSSAARADYCSPLTIEATAPMADNASGLVVIPATLGTLSKPMIVDTGGTISEITTGTVRDLNLKTFSNEFGPYNAAAHEEKAAGVSPFAIGNTSTKSYTFRVSSNMALSAVRGAAGSIASDILSNYDVDLDFGGGKVNLLSSDHCWGKVVYWQASAVAIIPVKVLSDGRVVVPVSVDGHAMNALLDTGSQTSTVSAEAAQHDLGVPAGSSGQSHAVQSLALEGISVTKLTVNVVPKLADASGYPVDDTAGANMTLGLDVLRHLHVYIAYKEQRLYLSPR